MSRTLHDVPVRIPDGLYAELWDCRDGAVYALPVRNNCVSVSLAPGAVRTVRLCREQRALPPLPLPPQTEPVFLRSPAGFRLNEPNVLPLDRAALWLDEELLCAQDEILKLDRTLRGRLGMEQRSGEMLQPWARKGPDTSYPIRHDLWKCATAQHKFPAKTAFHRMGKRPQRRLARWCYTRP